MLRQAVLIFERISIVIDPHLSSFPTCKMQPGLLCSPTYCGESGIWRPAITQKQGSTPWITFHTKCFIFHGIRRVEQAACSTNPARDNNQPKTNALLTTIFQPSQTKMFLWRLTGMVKQSSGAMGEVSQVYFSAPKEQGSEGMRVRNSKIIIDQ